MAVSRAYVQRQAGIVSKLSQSAGQVIAKMDLDDWDEAAAAMSTLCRSYTDMSAALSATYYEGIRKASRIKSKYTPVVSSGYVPDSVYSATISVLDEVQSGRATKPAAELLANVANREIKNAADNCIRANVKRDPAKPRYAIVPNGDACAFCQMRAAAGYTYADEDAVESHDHCTCTATPVFGNQTIEGYNPDEYAAKYDEARDALANGDISDELKAKIDAQKEAKGKDFDKTNAILMVMREQQNIS